MQYTVARCPYIPNVVMSFSHDFPSRAASSSTEFFCNGVPVHIKNADFEHLFIDSTEYLFSSVLLLSKAAILSTELLCNQERPFRACSVFSIACPCNIENEVDILFFILDHLQGYTLTRLHEVQLSETCR